MEIKTKTWFISLGLLKPFWKIDKQYRVPLWRYLFGIHTFGFGGYEWKAVNLFPFSIGFGPVVRG